MNQNGSAIQETVCFIVDRMLVGQDDSCLVLFFFYVEIKNLTRTGPLP